MGFLSTIASPIFYQSNNYQPIRLPQAICPLSLSFWCLPMPTLATSSPLSTHLPHADARLITTILSTSKKLYFALITFTNAFADDCQKIRSVSFTHWKRRKSVLIVPSTPPCANCAGGQEESQTAPPNLMKRRCSLQC